MLRTAFALALVAMSQASSWPTIDKSPVPTLPWETQAYSEGMQAWGDIPTSALVDIPDWLLNDDHAAWIPSSPLAEDTTVTIKCPSDIEGDVCDVYVYVYYCPPCSLHGGLPGILLSSGWEARSCAPHFILKASGEKHEMATFRKQVAKGSEVSFTTESEARFMGVGVSPFGETCPQIGMELMCRSSRHCAWENGACVDSWCPKTSNGGVRPICIECAEYESTDAPATSAPPTDAPKMCAQDGELCEEDDDCCSDKCKKKNGVRSCK